MATAASDLLFCKTFLAVATTESDLLFCTPVAVRKRQMQDELSKVNSHILFLKKRRINRKSLPCSWISVTSCSYNDTQHKTLFCQWSLGRLLLTRRTFTSVAVFIKRWQLFTSKSSVSNKITKDHNNKKAIFNSNISTLFLPNQYITVAIWF